MLFASQSLQSVDWTDELASKEVRRSAFSAKESRLVSYIGWSGLGQRLCGIFLVPNLEPCDG